MHVLPLHGDPSKSTPDVSPTCVFVHKLADISVLHVHNNPAEVMFNHETVGMLCR
jgi:hypothetical protein